MKRGLAAFKDRDFAYEDFTRRLNAQAVLDHYSADNAYEQTNTDGTTEVIHSCLLDRVEPHHQNGDQNPSAACNLDKKLYVCYSYWGGDLFHLIMKMEGKESLSGITDLLAQFLDGATKESSSFRDELERRLSDHTQAASRAVHSAYSARVLEPWAYTHPYIVERGVDLETASRLQIGYDPQVNRITIPHFWEGVLVGWQKRAIPERPGEWPGSDPAVPKYKSSSGFPKGTTLYHGGRHLEGSSVIVVESPFSVIKAAALGIEVPVVATFGAKITDTQLELMRDFGNVLVWMDDDEAGRRAERKVVNTLYRHTKVSVIEPDEGMDLGDYDSVESVQAKIDGAVSARRKLMQYDREKREWARSKLVSAH